LLYKTEFKEFKFILSIVQLKATLTPQKCAFISNISAAYCQIFLTFHVVNISKFVVLLNIIVLNNSLFWPMCYIL